MLNYWVILGNKHLYILILWDTHSENNFFKPSFVKKRLKLLCVKIKNGCRRNIQNHIFNFLLQSIYTNLYIYEINTSPLNLVIAV